MKVGKINNIEIQLNFSTLVIVALVGYYAAFILYLEDPNSSLLILFIVGIVNGVIILFSIFIHELMHSLLAQQYGLKVSEIEIYLFGGVSKIQEEPKTAKSEIIISSIGPIMSLILGTILLLPLLIRINYMPLYITLLYCGLSNILLGIFNFLPAFPMDGGRVLRAYLWKKRNNLLSATKSASKVGIYFGYALVILSFLSLFVSWFSGIWLVLSGWFLITAAKKAYNQTVYEVSVSNFRAREIAGAPKPAIPVKTLLADAISQYFIYYKHQYFPVVEGDRLLGIVHIDDVKKISDQLRSKMNVGDIIKKLSDLPAVYDDETGKYVLNKLISMKSEPRIALVIERTDHKLIGLIGYEDLSNILKFAEFKNIQQ